MSHDDYDWDHYDGDDFEFGAPRARGNSKRGKPDEGHDLGQVEVIGETDAALLVRGSGLSSDPFGLKDPNEEGWIPKSQIHSTSELQEDCGRGARGSMVITRWLAEKRGLL